MATLTDRLRAAPPGIHGAGDEYWGLAWPALEWLEAELRPDMATLETGSGASTIVFAAAGCAHVAVTPDAAEEGRVREACRKLGVSSERVSFEVGFSHDVLPRLAHHRLDRRRSSTARTASRTRSSTGGTSRRDSRSAAAILLDDAYMPPVTAVVDHVRHSPAWEIERSVGYRTVVIRKLADDLPPFDWEGERVGGHMTFRYLPAARARGRVDPASHLLHESGPGSRQGVPARLRAEVAEDRLAQRAQIRPRRGEAARPHQCDESHVEQAGRPPPRRPLA